MQLHGAFTAMVNLTITTGNTLFQQAPNTTTTSLIYYKLTVTAKSLILQLECSSFITFYTCGKQYD